MFDEYCGDTALSYIGRYEKFRAEPHSMFYDEDLHTELSDEDLFYAPADLGDEAFYKGLAKFGKKPFEVKDDVCFQTAVRMMRLHFGRHLRGCAKWDLDTVLANMRRDTSPGPALKTLYDSKGDAVDDARFWHYYSEFCSDMQKLGGSISYWGSSSKEELRLLEKVDAKKTRVFMSGSLMMYLFTSVYCGDFNDKFYKSYRETVSAVGMSKFSGGFHLLFKRLHWKKTCGMTDASGWDTDMFPDLLWAIAQFRADCLFGCNNYDRVAFANIYQQIVESFLCTPSGEICQKFQGNPSGSANTIVDNTLGHFILKCYCWLKCMGEDIDVDRAQEYLYDLEDNVFMKLFGDDDVFSVSPEASVRYTPVNIVKYAKELGFTLTLLSDEWLHRHDLEFLSHRVVKVRGFYLPYLSLDRLKAAAVYSISPDLEIRAQRLTNLRYEGFYTPGWLPIIDRLISTFLTLHPDCQVIVSSSLNDSEIEYLYLPLESASGNTRERVLKDEFCYSFRDILDGEPGPWPRYEQGCSTASQQTQESACCGGNDSLCSSSKTSNA